MKIFYMIFIAAGFHFLWRTSKPGQLAVVALIVMNTGTSLIWSGRAMVSDKGRTTVTVLEDELSGIFGSDKSYLVLGPTEIWPFVTGARLVVEDNNRARPTSPVVRELLAKCDFVVVNRDYRSYGWKKMLAEYSSPEVQLVKRIKGHNDTIEVYRIEIPPRPEGID